MSPFAGPLLASALLLAAAGVAKVTKPAATRVALRSAGMPNTSWVARGLGLGELAIAGAAIVIGGPVPAALVVGAYLGFAGFAARLDRRTRGTAPCGCFGDSDAPVGTLHVVVNLATAAVVAGAVLWPTDGLAGVTGETPLAGAVFVGLALLLAWMLYATLTVLPAISAAARPVEAPT